MDNTSQSAAKQRATRFMEIEYPTIYSNIIGIGASPYDISIVFGVVDNATETEVMAKPLVKVLMAPEQAANVVKIISKMLERYQEANGQLRTSSTVDLVTVPEPS
jgi:hypothetical protein